MWELNKNQKLILKYNYEFALAIMTPGIMAAVVSLVTLFFYGD